MVSSTAVFKVNSLLNCRVDACGRDLVDKLVKVFEKLYFTPKVRMYVLYIFHHK